MLIKMIDEGDNKVYHYCKLILKCLQPPKSLESLSVQML